MAKPRPAAPGATETAIVSSILAQLKLRRVLCWRANSGTIVIPATDRAQRRVVKGAPAGTPDIVGVLPGGILFALEVKAPGGKLRPSQEEWHTRARENGARTAIVFSAAEAVRVYEGWVGR